jgi:ribokinase
MSSAEEKRLDILCVADLCVDLVLTGDVRPRFGQFEQLIDDYALELGGSADLFATQFVKLGGRAGVIGRAGGDAFGDFALARLRSLGVDVSRVRRDAGLKTGIGVALSEPADRAILTYLGSIDGVEPADLTGDLLGSSRHWHLASYFLLSRLRAFWPGWLRRCKERGVTTSLDTNWDPADRWDGVTELLHWTDVFLPNDAEALAISGESGVETAGRKLAAFGPLVIVKRGADGVAAFSGGRCWTAPAAGRPGRVVDTTGAGDNFDAGFLRAWLLGRDVPECIELGQRCAFASLHAAGGIEGQLCEDIR